VQREGDTRSAQGGAACASGCAEHPGRRGCSCMRLAGRRARGCCGCRAVPRPPFPVRAQSSTVQILGAEKALFRALKTRGNTPKYGLIFHSSFIGRAKQRNKGRISRYLANKASIASRIDCFSETVTSAFGEKLKEQVRTGMGSATALWALVLLFCYCQLWIPFLGLHY
jgi:snoRNA binding domain, fibrillarin